MLVELQIEIPSELFADLYCEAARLRRMPEDLASLWLAEAIRSKCPKSPPLYDPSQLDLFGDESASHYDGGL